MKPTKISMQDGSNIVKSCIVTYMCSYSPSSYSSFEIGESGKKNRMDLSWLYLQLFLSGIFYGDALRLGKNAREGQFPYLAHILIDKGLVGTGFCGGAILDKTHILTAAHCVTRGLTPVSHARVKVIVGRTKIYRENLKLSVAKITVHPKFKRPEEPTATDVLLAALPCTPSIIKYYTAQNDIAVLTLKEPLHMGQNFETINYRQRDKLHYGDKCDFAGWGSEQPDKLPMKLKSAQLKVLKKSQCEASLLPTGPEDFCALDEDNGARTLAGDSGSPLVCYGSLVGILSMGRKNCNDPDLFVRVSHYRRFIIAALKN